MRRWPGANKSGRKLSPPPSTQSLGHASNASIKLREWHGQLSEYKKAGIVRAGLLRRVFGEIYQTLKKGECHYDRGAHNHETKKAQRRKFLEKTEEERKNRLTFILDVTSRLSPP
jgi:hypothetical protein